MFKSFLDRLSSGCFDSILHASEESCEIGGFMSTHDRTKPAQGKAIRRLKNSSKKTASNRVVSPGRPLDAIDSKIISLLQKDGRATNIQIAKTIGISEATVRNRLQRLIEERIVQIVAVCDPFRIGFGIVGNIKIHIDAKRVNTILDELKKLPEVWYIALTTGGSDIDIDFNVKSLDDLRTLVYDKINKIDGIMRTETSVIMDFVKRRYDWGTAF